MEIVVIGSLALVALLYFRWRRPVALEAARSYLYLEALREGATNHEANERAPFDEQSLTLTSQRLARLYRQRAYSRQILGTYVWPQIGEAYRRGMQPILLPDSIWRTVYDWSRKEAYEFPPVVRSKLLNQTETAYERYYSDVVARISQLSHLSSQQIDLLVHRIDDEGFRNAFNNGIPAREWATTIQELYLRPGAPLAIRRN